MRSTNGSNVQYFALVVLITHSTLSRPIALLVTVDAVEGKSKRFILEFYC
jgi:hypothetical protein